MSLTIGDFKTTIVDIARPNRFGVLVLPNPSVFEPVGEDSLLSTVSNVIQGARFLMGNPKAVYYLAKMVTIPERTFGTLEHKRLGITRKVAGDPSYNTVDITFMNDTSYSTRTLIDAWHENIIHQGSNYRQYANKYSEGSTIIVEKLGLKGVPFAIYKYNDVWPKSINAETLAMDTNDTVSEFTVSFEYNTWTRII